MKQFLRVLAFILLFLLIVCGSLFFYAQNLLSPLAKKQEAVKTYCVIIPSGTTLRQVAVVLQNEQIIKSEKAFYYYGRYLNTKLRAGRFSVNSGQSVSQILNHLQSGKQEDLKVSFPEGLSLSEVAQVLDTAGVTSKENFMAAASDPAVLVRHKISAASVEGYLFPDTYYFLPQMKAGEVIDIMVDNFFKKIQVLSLPKNLDPKELHNIVILASIVECEYRVPEEAPLIASVFKNRLSYNIGLESCATIVYIITEINHQEHPDRVTYEDLKINNPYNTYKWAGLPPGPIANPGMVSLKAAANPPKTDYFYFRLINEGTGQHFFSKTLEEHSGARRNLTTKKNTGN